MYVKSHTTEHGSRNVWNIVGARCRVQDPTLLERIPRFQAVIKPVSDVFCVFVATFTVVLTLVLRKLCHKMIKQLVFRDSMMKKVFLSHNIVGAEYIVCTHWLNIVDAAAPAAPMVPTPMQLQDPYKPISDAPCVCDFLLSRFCFSKGHYFSWKCSLKASSTNARSKNRPSISYLNSSPLTEAQVVGTQLRIMYIIISAG